MKVLLQVLPQIEHTTHSISRSIRLHDLVHVYCFQMYEILDCKRYNIVAGQRPSLYKKLMKLDRIIFLRKRKRVWIDRNTQKIPLN